MPGSYLSKEGLHGGAVPQRAQAVRPFHEGLTQVPGTGPETEYHLENKLLILCFKFQRLATGLTN